MVEPTPAPDAPEWVLQIVGGSLQFSDAALRLYAHPDLLRVAAAFNGEDFTPFNEVIWIKHPRLGGSVAWHQDGTTHWGTAKFHKGSHGFNFMAQLYGCNSANGLWVGAGLAPREGRHQGHGAMRRDPTACRTRCPCSASPETWGSPTARPS